ncbi:Myomegalin [Liparis tanakae]|uniref:Myomegalin n=1 Tax=Liparis tanakae TaxID=230148 RepID=A0A4Z2HRA2_9TELE|nr:Myomegalin [Liparis tanakae]
MSNGYRTLSQHLNDLKKENFSLKLRIYFLEERIQQKYEESSEDVYRTNIELKVEVESLKQELQEKQQLLDKALTAESLTNHNEAELQRRCRERQQEIDHMEQEAQLARSEAERMASLTGSHSNASLFSLDTPMEDTPEDERPLSILSPSTTNKDRCPTPRHLLKHHEYPTNQIHLPVLTGLSSPPSVSRLIEELTKDLCSKETLITELSGEKTTLTLRVGELEGQVQELSSSLLQKDKDVDPGGSPTSRSTRAAERVFSSLHVGEGSDMNTDSFTDPETGGRSDDCPRTPVTALRPRPDYYRSPVITDLMARGEAGVSATAD